MILSRAVSVLALAAVSQAQNPYPVTGAAAPGGGPAVPLRKNINDLQREGGPTWDLYIQALAAMYSTADSDWLSYFQIAGIHGEPYIQWNHTGSQAGDGWLGYCPHGEAIFATWHRPYVMLFEQVLVNNALRIASTYPSRYRASYMDAAQNLRAPFWDWGADSTVPQSTVPTSLPINVVSGNTIRQVQFDNPLQTYNFPKAALNGKYGDFEPGASRTVRCPSPKSYPSSANANLADRPYKQWVYDTMTQATTFINFASTSGDGINLESIHNAIHWDGACAQQFLAPETSAFDPLFWLHHSNVDRLWAYWEALQPDQTVFTNTYSGQSRWGVKGGTTISNQSPLLPFYGADGQLYTSTSVTSLSTFGYTYEGMEYWAKSADQMKSDVSTIINKLYATKSSGLFSRDAATSSRPQQKQRHFVKLSVNVADLTVRPVDIAVYVGGKKACSMVVMRLPATGMVKGGCSIDDALEELQSSNTTMSALNAAQNLRDFMTVDIQKIDGSRIPVSSVPSLQFQAETVDVILPTAINKLPEFGQRIQHTVFKVLEQTGE
ncbi:Tyrosinase [Escovopsis weberi]|uniref:Tyrosinase n=1 Tax=Escovopsis weberi TaxID=150374 RepID=A0A0M8N0I4_ESCWE|nr:Tyrosinase [Escovopsis weberi]